MCSGGTDSHGEGVTLQAPWTGPSWTGHTSLSLRSGPDVPTAQMWPSGHLMSDCYFQLLYGSYMGSHFVLRSGEACEQVPTFCSA